MTGVQTCALPILPDEERDWPDAMVAGVWMAVFMIASRLKKQVKTAWFAHAAGLMRFARPVLPPRDLLTLARIKRRTRLCKACVMVVSGYAEGEGGVKPVRQAASGCEYPGRGLLRE